MNKICLTLLILFGLWIFNQIWLALYCRIEKKVDLIKNSSMQKFVSETNDDSFNKRGNIKTIFKDIYKWLDHYFYGWMRYNIIQTGKIPSNRIRRLFYRHVYNMQISKKTVISANCEIRSPWNIKLGNCIVAGGCILDGRAGIDIEDNAVLGMNVHIWTQEHDLNSPYFEVNCEHMGKVLIKQRAWVCSDTTLLPGVTVEYGAVVATKACVTKNCEELGIYGGVPAKRIGTRNSDLKYELSGKPHWHFN